MTHKKHKPMGELPPRPWEADMEFQQQAPPILQSLLACTEEGKG